MSGEATQLPWRNEYEFASMIAATLAANPSWHKSAIQGVTGGMAVALDEARDRAGASDLAMRAALVLMDAKRVTPEIKNSLVPCIMKAIDTGPNASPIERKFAKGGAA